MTKYERKNGDAVIYAETNKRNERGPDWRGTCILNGVEYELALWAKGGKGTMLAGNIKPARGRQAADRGGSRDVRKEGSGGFSGGFDERRFSKELDDEIPFISQWSLT